MEKNLGPLFILVAASLWSLDGLLRRSLGLPALTIVCYEHVLGFLVLLPFLYCRRAELQALRRREVFLPLLWVSFWGGLAGTWCYTQALAEVRYISFSVVVLLQQLQPVFAILLAWIILKERITARFIAWAVAAMAGAYLISFPGLKVNWQNDHGTIIAALLALCAAFAWGSSTVFGKKALAQLHFATTTALRFFLTLVFITPLLVACQLWDLGAYGSLVPPTWLTAKQIGLLLAITFSAGMVAMLIYYYGLNKVEAKVSTVCEMFWPLSAIAIDILRYETKYTWSQMFGGVLLLVSIYQVASLSKNIPKQ